MIVIVYVRVRVWSGVIIRRNFGVGLNMELWWFLVW